MKFGTVCPQTFTGRAMVSLQVLLSVTINAVVKVPEAAKVLLGALMVLLVALLLV